MAQVEKYNVHSKSPFGDDRIFKIYEEGYVGAVINVLGTRQPVNHAWPGSDTDIYEPIMGTEQRINLVAENADQYIEFATATNKQYLGQLYNTTQATIEWQGWYVPEEFEQNESSLPQTVNLTFSCGLGYLRQIDYLNGSSYYTGRERDIVILARALAEITADSPNNLNIRTIINLHPTGASTVYTHDALYYAYTDQNKYINDDGTVWDCLAVIKDIVQSYGARIIMGHVGWWVIRIRALALLIDDKDMYYAVYTSAGVYSARSVLTPAQSVEIVTGPHVTSRSEDIAWTGRSKRVRYQRAVKQIRVWFDHGYRSILKAGTFPESYLDFWSIEDGTIARVVDTSQEDAYKLRMNQTLSSDRAELDQIVYNINAESADQLLTFTAELRYTGSEDAEDCQFQIEGFLDADSGSGNDRWMSGQIDNRSGGVAVAPNWSVPSIDVRWILTAPSGEWVTVEMTFPAVPFTGDLTIRLLNSLPELGASGTPEFSEWRNVKMFGTYDGNEIVKLEKRQLTISENNLLNPPPTNITSADIEDNGNEWVFCTGAKSLNADGDLLTTTWRSFYASGGAKVMHGPDQSLIKYLEDGGVIQYGMNRRRLQGSLTFNSHRLARSLIKDGDYYYVPTSLGYDYMSSMLRSSMLELPAIEEIVLNDNLIIGWENSLVDPWDTFTLTSDTITIDALEQLAASGEGRCATEDGIDSLVAYESFRVRVSGTFDTEKPTLTIGSWSGVIDDGDDFVITPRTTAGNNTVLLEQDPSVNTAHSDILIQVTRIYGF